MKSVEIQKMENISFWQRQKNSKLFWLSQRLHYYYPFSFFGTWLVFAEISLIVYFILTTNPITLFISLILGLILSLTAILARSNALILKKVNLEWDSSAPLTAGDPDCYQSFYVGKLKIFPLFSLQFRLSGYLQVGLKARIWVLEEQPLISRKNCIPKIYLYFPLCGILKAKGQFIIRDILGIARAVVRLEPNREMTVLPASLLSQRVKEIITNQGFEESLKSRAQEEERYFMREYVPGDRLRDINWKSSLRFAKLITRIAPYSQEQTKAVVIFLRNLRESSGESFESIVVLNRLKSLLYSFLIKLKQDGKEYVFQLFTADDKFILETEEDISLFAKELVKLPYAPSFCIEGFNYNLAEFFVFSTVYDTHLGAFLTLFPQAKATAIQVVPELNPKKIDNQYRFFENFRASLIPGAFLLKREKKLNMPALFKSANLNYEQDLIKIDWW